ASAGRDAMIVVRLRAHDEAIPGFRRLNERIGDLSRALHERRVAQQELEARARELETLGRELALQRDRAELANLAKSRFLAAMSHELRTPLNTIIGYIELLHLGLSGPITPKQRAQLERVTRTANHLISIINEILNFSRHEVEHAELDRRPV